MLPHASPSAGFYHQSLHSSRQKSERNNRGPFSDILGQNCINRLLASSSLQGWWDTLYPT